MDNIKDSLKDLTEIRSMMERSSKFLSLSGLAGVGAGAVALAGAAAAHWVLSADENTPGAYDVQILLLVDAIGVLALAVAIAIFFTTRMARKQQLPIWTGATRQTIASLLGPLITGGLFCFIAWYHDLTMLIAPATLIFYGLALLNSSNRTPAEVRYLALAEIGLGLLAMLFPSGWLVLWAAGFGILHILYGVLMYVKYER